ncbi:hypothetical protein GCM10009844_22370 [Nocardioides koreensis]|uniref:HAD family hydrolase n=1 Tax=Nocardioides koreensis TaxID=433651 RepID=A0ABP5LK04_9ACTN
MFFDGDGTLWDFDAVMVGDSLAHDVEAAQRAGWRGIWLNRRGAVNESHTEPDAEISTLAELPNLIAGLADGTC